MPATGESEAIVRLQRLGKRRARLLNELGKVEAELLEEAIPAAHADGVPVLAISRAAGVVRQTVYNVLARLGDGKGTT